MALNWKRARKYAGREEKYGVGAEMNNGRIVAKPRALSEAEGSLAYRAAKAEKRWVRNLSKKAKRKLGVQEHRG